MRDADAAHDLATTLKDECLAVRVGRLQRIVARHYAHALRAHGLSVPQMELLATLTLHAEPMTPADLAEALALERSTMSRNLALLVESGWVSGQGVSPTGRRMAVTVTPAGRRKLAGARRAWKRAQTSAVDALGVNAVTTLDRWLGGLARGLDAGGAS